MKYLNDLLSVKVREVTVVRSYRLGILRMSILLLVILYFIIYEMMISRSYLHLSPIIGTVGMYAKGFMKGFAAPQAYELPHCSEYNGTERPTYLGNICPCREMAYEWVDAGTGSGEIFIPMMFRRRAYNITCVSSGSLEDIDECVAPDADQLAAGLNLGERSGFTHLINAEHLLIKLMHRAISSNIREDGYAFDPNKFTGNLMLPNGSLQVIDKSASLDSPKDYITLSQLMVAAGVKLTEASHDYRRTGLTLIAEIHYEHDWMGRFSGYTYHVSVAGAGSNRYAYHESNLGATANVPLHQIAIGEQRTGVQVVWRQTGQVGGFGFQEVLLAAMRASALAAVAPLIILLVLKYTMRDKWETHMGASRIIPQRPRPQPVGVTAMTNAYGESEQSANSDRDVEIAENENKEEIEPTVSL